MARVRSKKDASNKKQEKWREKTIHEHCLDGIVKILKELSEEDNVNYHLVMGSNQCTPSGSEELVQVDGSCKVGYFTMDNRHFLGKDGKGFNVTYKFVGKIKTDQWGQKEIDIDSHIVDGLDHMQGKH